MSLQFVKDSALLKLAGVIVSAQEGEISFMNDWLKENGSVWEKLAARCAHLALYCAMLLIPLTGWLAFTEHVRRSLGMRPASWFGFPIPLLPDFAINWHRIHNWGGKQVLARLCPGNAT